MSDIMLVLVGAIGGIATHMLLWQLPRFWKWLRFKVWWDYRYAAGYRKGLAVGHRRIDEDR